MRRGHEEGIFEPMEAGLPAPQSADLRALSTSEGAFPQFTPSHDRLVVSPQDWLDCWSGLDHRARMIVNTDRIYVIGDRRAEQALAARQDLRLNAGRLEAANPTGMSELDSLMRVEEGEVRTTVVPRRHRGGHLLMRSTQIGVPSSQIGAPSGQIGAPSGMSLLGITFWIADEKLMVEWPDFGPVFGLTAAETKIVEQLIQGLGAEAIGANLQVSINTVRTHISHVYEKLGITCREELWRRLAPYRLN